MKKEVIYKAFAYVEDGYLDIADDFLQKPKASPHSLKRKTLMGLLAAVICISLLAATAVAAGWVPGIFRILQDRIPSDHDLFEFAAQANTESVPEVVEIPQLDLSQLVLLERYFDGNTVLLGYDLDAVLPDPVVGVEPGEEMLRKIRRGSRMSTIGWDSPQDWFAEPDTANGKKYNLGRDAFEMDRMLKGILSENEYKKAWDILKETGWVCLTTRSVWLSDTILIDGHDLREEYNSESNAYSGRTEYTTELGDCLRLDPLPEDVKNRDKITVTLTVRTAVQYLYMDLDGNGRIYTDSNSVESEQISFELERSERND